MIVSDVEIDGVKLRLQELSETVMAWEVKLAFLKAVVLSCLNSTSRQVRVGNRARSTGLCKFIGRDRNILQGPAIVYWAVAQYYDTLDNGVQASHWASLALEAAGKRAWREQEKVLHVAQRS